ncbi:MAG: hypothetical protein LBQ90_04735 [Synergistaceae bacterium]|jgi:hypothetical protein|nr:hypothetical protein [Synergistaceae bacterium]
MSGNMYLLAFISGIIIAVVMISKIIGPEGFGILVAGRVLYNKIMK